jgi:hypothetical protein
MRQAGNVECTGTVRYVYAILVGNRHVKQTTQNTKIMQMGSDVKEYLKETGYEEAGLSQLARGSAQGRSF